MSRVSLYNHFVWSTYRRQPFLSEAWEAEAYAVICAEVQQLGCQVLQIGGMPDHVHLLIWVPARLAPMKVMQQAKGVCSRALSERMGLSGALWQEGYGVFSVSRTDVEKVRCYIENQKKHHAQNTTWASLEEEESSPGP